MYCINANFELLEIVQHDRILTDFCQKKDDKLGNCHASFFIREITLWHTNGESIEELKTFTVNEKAHFDFYLYDFGEGEKLAITDSGFFSLLNDIKYSLDRYSNIDIKESVEKAIEFTDGRADDRRELQKMTSEALKSLKNILKEEIVSHIGEMKK